MNDKPTFPLGRSSLRVTVAAWAAGVVVAAAVLLGWNEGDAQVGLRAVLWSMLSVWLLALVGLRLVKLVESRGAFTVTVMYFVGASLRMVGCIAAVVMGVMGSELPLKTLAITMLVVYMPVLATEATAVGRFMWELDGGGNAKVEMRNAR